MGVRERVFFLLLQGHNPSGSGLQPYNLNILKFNLKYLLKTLSPGTVTPVVRAPTYELYGDPVQSIAYPEKCTQDSYLY